MSLESTHKPMIRTVTLADLKCYLCGSTAGTVEGEGNPLPPRVTFRKPGEATALPVLDWHRIRCERCGGPTYVDEAETISQRIEEYNWLDERPRRGRPPKRLVEERRRERELADKQAA